MSLFRGGRQPGLCSLRFAALATYLLQLLSEICLLGLRQLIAIEVPGHVNAEVAGRDALQLDQLLGRDLREAGDPSREIDDRSRAPHEIHGSQQWYVTVVLRL